MPMSETVKIDLDNLTCSEAWKLVKRYENKEIDLEINTLLSSRFATILSEAPENIIYNKVNGYTIETSDCYKRLYLRIPELGVTKWMCYIDVNNWNSQMSWTPEYINFIVENEQYVIVFPGLELYKLLTKESTLNK